jgi:cell division protein FtsW
MALGSGGWTGVGLMKSRLKANYLPEAHTDFILAVTGEELGFVGICTVLLLYVLWGFFALQIAFRSRDRMGLLAGWALTVGIIVQALINIGAMSGCFPTKGMPAPFISYGGSNLLGCLIANGILVAIAAYNDNPDYRKLFRRRSNDDSEGDL